MSGAPLDVVPAPQPGVCGHLLPVSGCDSVAGSRFGHFSWATCLAPEQGDRRPGSTLMPPNKSPGRGRLETIRVTAAANGLLALFLQILLLLEARLSRELSESDGPQGNPEGRSLGGTTSGAPPGGPCGRRSSSTLPETWRGSSGAPDPPVTLASATATPQSLGRRAPPCRPGLAMGAGTLARWLKPLL